MTKPNKDGWVRHRGGKCPVEKGALVDVRYRDGTFGYKLEAGRDYHFDTEHHSGWDAHFEYWDHDRMSGDIMAWRPHKPEQVIVSDVSVLTDGLEVGTPKKAESLVIDYSPSLHIQSLGRVYRHEGDPRRMRDRIREIDGERFEAELSHAAHIERLDHERTSLVAKLKAEGFALIQSDEPNGEVESVQDDIAKQDMSDWRNWQKGDKCEVTDPLPADPFCSGELVELLESGDDAPFCKGSGNDRWAMAAHQLKWHSRPTN